MRFIRRSSYTTRDLAWMVVAGVFIGQALRRLVDPTGGPVVYALLTILLAVGMVMLPIWHWRRS